MRSNSEWVKDKNSSSKGDFILLLCSAKLFSLQVFHCPQIEDSKIFSRAVLVKNIFLPCVWCILTLVWNWCPDWNVEMVTKRSQLFRISSLSYRRTHWKENSMWDVEELSGRGTGISLPRHCVSVSLTSDHCVLSQGLGPWKGLRMCSVFSLSLVCKPALFTKALLFPVQS